MKHEPRGKEDRQASLVPVVLRFSARFLFLDCVRHPAILISSFWSNWFELLSYAAKQFLTIVILTTTLCDPLQALHSTSWALFMFLPSHLCTETFTSLSFYEGQYLLASSSSSTCCIYLFLVTWASVVLSALFFSVNAHWYFSSNWILNSLRPETI